MTFVGNAGQHEGEVSSGVQSKKAAGRSPSRLSRQTGGAAPEQETSSLQALAAAADSGEIALEIITPICMLDSDYAVASEITSPC